MQVQKDYPKGNKVPDAMLKHAMALAAQGKKQAARDKLRKLISRFPKHEVRQMAKQQLRGLAHVPKQDRGQGPRNDQPTDVKKALGDDLRPKVSQKLTSR